MQDETQRTAAEAEAESALPAAPEVSTGDVQALGGAATRAARQAERKPGQEKPRQMKVGRVVSDKMEKTIVVELESRVQHPKYGKIIRTTKKVKAHDEDGVAGVGDRVSLMETRPLSATKRWRLVDILEKAK